VITGQHDIMERGRIGTLAAIVSKRENGSRIRVAEEGASLSFWRNPPILPP
jgi:hypothetical protein